MPDRPAPSTRGDYPAFRTLQTRWRDGDVYGHVNNVVHYELFDTVVNGWMLGHGVLDPKSGKTIGLVVESGCRYSGEIVFPDTVTARGARHLDEMADMVREGHRAVMVYLVQRGDCESMRLCRELDPAYGAAFDRAAACGVEAIAIRCQISPEEIAPAKPIPLVD